MRLRHYSGAGISEIDVDSKVFSEEFNIPLVHQLLVTYQANGRVAISQQKNRATVSHSTRKPWKQKGTGRARSGMTSSPIWRGGGRTFPNLAIQTYAQKLNRVMFRSGMCSLLAQAARMGRVTVCESFDVTESKTKSFLAAISAIAVVKRDERVLLLLEDCSDRVLLASRNVHNIAIRNVQNLDPLSLYRSHKIVISRESLTKIERLLT